MSYIEQFRQLPPDAQANAVRRMLGGVTDPGRIEMGLALVLTNEDTARTALAMSPPAQSIQNAQPAPEQVAPPTVTEGLRPDEMVESYEDFYPADQGVPGYVQAPAEPQVSTEGMPPDWIERTLQFMAGGAAAGAAADAYKGARHTPPEVVPDPTKGTGVRGPRQGDVLSPDMDQLGDLRQPSYDQPPQVTQQQKLSAPPEDVDVDIQKAMRGPAQNIEQDILSNIPDDVRYGERVMPLPGKPPLEQPAAKPVVEEKVETLDDLQPQKAEFEPVAQRGVAGYKRKDSMGVDRYYDEKGNLIGKQGTIEEYEDWVDKQAGPTELEQPKKTVKKKAPAKKTQTKETASKVEEAVKKTAPKKKSAGLPESAHPFQYQNRTYYVGDMADDGMFEVYTKTGRRAGESIRKRAQIAAKSANQDRSANAMKKAKKGGKAAKAAKAVSKAIK